MSGAISEAVAAVVSLFIASCATCKVGCGLRPPGPTPTPGVFTCAQLFCTEGPVCEVDGESCQRGDRCNSMLHCVSAGQRPASSRLLGGQHRLSCPWGGCVGRMGQQKPEQAAESSVGCQIYSLSLVLISLTIGRMGKTSGCFCPLHPCWGRAEARLYRNPMQQTLANEKCLL